MPVNSIVAAAFNGSTFRGAIVSNSFLSNLSIGSILPSLFALLMLNRPLGKVAWTANGIAKGSDCWVQRTIKMAQLPSAGLATNGK